MRDLLSDNGAIFVHLDWHAGHYVKILMDEIFGLKNFRNEIIWYYADYLQGNVSNAFPRKNDFILFYSKTDKSLNPQVRTLRV
jgi:adenine specific DNA methylase Mod